MYRCAFKFKSEKWTQQFQNQQIENKLEINCEMFIYLKFVIKGNTDGTSWWIGGFQNPDQDWTWVTGKVTLNMKYESLLEGGRFVNYSSSLI